MTRVLTRLTPEAVRSGAETAGERVDDYRSAVEGAAASLLMALANRSADGNFASRLMAWLESGAPFADLIRLALGSSADSVAHGLAAGARVQPVSARQGLMAAAGLVAGALVEEHGRQPFTASSLSRALEALREPVRAFLPESVAWLSGAFLPSTGDRGEVSLATRAAQVTLVAAVMFGVMSFYRGLPETGADVPKIVKFVRAAPQAVDMSLPGGQAVNLIEGSFNYRLLHFLGDANDQQVPRAFVFDHLNFFTAEKRITPESAKTVDDLIAILKAFPQADIRLEGHTDNQGDPAANQSLSLARADAIRAVLTSRGITARRVTTAGFGQTQPVASNETEEGRAENRRLELVVVKK